MNDEPKKFSIPHSAFIILAFLIMLCWTWLGWPDPITDFGRELYVPWQITQGKILYHDLAYFNGPLSPYFNALVFEIFGVSLRSIVIVNLILLLLLTWLIRRLWRKMADEFTATVACVLLLTVFSFLWVNYNFVTPYSHEITHGVILSFAAIASLAANKKWLPAAGFFLGLAFLTKAEIFAALLPAIFVGILLSKRDTKSIIGFLAGFVPPLVVAAVLFGTRGLLGSWNYVFDRRITGLEFYRRVFGTWDASIFIAFAGYLVLAGFALAAAKLPRKKEVSAAILIAGLILAAILFGTLDLSIWQQSLRGLTILSPLIAITTLIAAIRTRKTKAILAAVVSIFACGLLAKIFLNVTSTHYGFALAMPAVLVTVAAALSWWPNWIEKRNGNSAAARAVFLPAIAFLIFMHLYVFATRELPKPDQVGTNGDEFFADAPRMGPRGRAVDRMVQILNDLPPGKTLAVLPEGTMINYLSRRPSSTPYYTLMPPEMLMFGQDEIVAAYRKNPPDYIVVLNTKLSDPSEYGYKDFSQDYGSRLYGWLTANYGEIDIQQGPNFPMKLLERKTR